MNKIWTWDDVSRSFSSSSSSKTSLVYLNLTWKRTLIHHGLVPFVDKIDKEIFGASINLFFTLISKQQIQIIQHEEFLRCHRWLSTADVTLSRFRIQGSGEDSHHRHKFDVWIAEIVCDSRQFIQIQNWLMYRRPERWGCGSRTIREIRCLHGK